MGQQLFRQKYQAASNYQGEDDYNDETFDELMNLARLELPAYAEEVLRADKRKLYSDFKVDLEMWQWPEEYFPEATFALLLDIICDSRFLESRNGWPLLGIFESDWEEITETQKEGLLDVLAQTYEKFDDWMPCFSVSELVGENFAPALAYDFFRRFQQSSNETARSFVPHGLEHALENSLDADLKNKLWSALLQMKRDQSEKVRGEVEESLFRLANRGLLPPQ